MDKFEIFARSEDSKKLENIVAKIDPEYTKFINFHITGDTVFFARGGPELIVNCMANGAVSVSLC